MENFKIFASLNIDSLEPWIWTNYENNSKGYITIRNKINGKKIKCFKRTIDDNFLKLYNKDEENRIPIITDQGYFSLVMNEYYRNKLDIETKKTYMLSIKRSNLCERLFLNWHHPNPQVQYGNRMSTWSIIFGILSVILGLITLIPLIKSIF